MIWSRERRTCGTSRITLRIRSLLSLSLSVKQVSTARCTPMRSDPATATSWAGSSPNPSCGVPFAHSRTRCSLLRKTKDHVRVACDTYRHGTCSTCHQQVDLPSAHVIPSFQIFRLLNYRIMHEMFSPLRIMFRLSIRFCFCSFVSLESAAALDFIALRLSQRLTFADAGKLHSGGTHETRAQLGLK